MVKKLILFLLFLVLAVSGVSADVVDDFDGIIDFSMTLKDLDKRVSRGESPESLGDRLFLLDGAVSAIEIISGEEEPFLAVIDLVSGQWIGMEDVERYTCKVIVRGPQFEKRIPRRRRRNPAPDEILVNSTVLVLTQLIDIIEDESGNRLALLEGYYLRDLK